ncbi:hypothetical protein CEXT_804971 [Caerostris extrusa]|uniref:Uncharacterized protein n=1 Tax=Caerostris extrusa TaxID=172846 RepID=A0AAV4MD10_CAEEX|nr:hypothetical protein CEXT_804971 [Caerostris extrusa]
MSVTFEAAPQHSFCCLPPNTETATIPSTNTITVQSITNISTFMRMTDASDSGRTEIVYKFPSDANIENFYSAQYPVFPSN